MEVLIHGTQTGFSAAVFDLTEQNKPTLLGAGRLDPQGRTVTEMVPLHCQR